MYIIASCDVNQTSVYVSVIIIRIIFDRMFVHKLIVCMLSYLQLNVRLSTEMLATS